MAKQLGCRLDFFVTQSSVRWVKIRFDDLSPFHIKLPVGVSKKGNAVHHMC